MMFNDFLGYFEGPTSWEFGAANSDPHKDDPCKTWNITGNSPPECGSSGGPKVCFSWLCFLSDLYIDT